MRDAQPPLVQVYTPCSSVAIRRALRAFLCLRASIRPSSSPFSSVSCGQLTNARKTTKQNNVEREDNEGASKEEEEKKMITKKKKRERKSSRARGPLQAEGDSALELRHFSEVWLGVELLGEGNPVRDLDAPHCQRVEVKPLQLQSQNVRQVHDLHSPEPPPGLKKSQPLYMILGCRRHSQPPAHDSGMEEREGERRGPSCLPVSCRILCAASLPPSHTLARSSCPSSLRFSSYLPPLPAGLLQALPQPPSLPPSPLLPPSCIHPRWCTPSAGGVDCGPLKLTWQADQRRPRLVAIF